MKTTEKISAGFFLVSTLVGLGNFVLFMVGPVPFVSLIATGLCLGAAFMAGKELGWW